MTSPGSALRGHEVDVVMLGMIIDVLVSCQIVPPRNLAWREFSG
jgi:hypothetical protein